jgi:hypothetical protein
MRPDIQSVTQTVPEPENDEALMDHAFTISHLERCYEQ